MLQHVVAARDLDRHAARARLRAGERQLDAEDAVGVGGARLVRDDLGAERDHAAERAEVDLELLVEAALGVVGAAMAGDDELAALDLERQLVRVDAGQLGLHDGARRVALVEDVDGGEKPPRLAGARPVRSKTSPKSSSISRRMRSKFANRSRSGGMRRTVLRAMRPTRRRRGGSGQTV